MRNCSAIAIVVGLLCAVSTGAQSSEPSTRLEPLPRDLEIQLALSALPPHLRDKAAVYVLNPTRGFELARKGSNGFHAFVARTGDDSFKGDWPLTNYRDDILYPISFDSAGVDAQMRVFFDAAKEQAKGTPADKLKKLVQQRYRKGIYRAPKRAGVSYMLSPVLRTYTSPEETDNVATANFPHVMYYAPDVSNHDIGGGQVGGPYPAVILHGHHGYTIQPIGVTETAALTREYAPMLESLCKIKESWCLPKQKAQ